MSRFMFKAACAAAIFVSGSAATAANLVVESGILTGAKNVDVGGKLYDVEFLDGTCEALFSGCDQTTDFGIQSQSDARAAAQALLDQVLLDGPLGNFDSDTSKTRGCSSLTICGTAVPYSLNFNGVAVIFAENYPAGGLSDETSSLTFSGFNFASIPDLNFARFTPAAVTTPVPESATWAMMIGGFGLLGAAARRRKPNVTYA